MTTVTVVYAAVIFVRLASARSGPAHVTNTGCGERSCEAGTAAEVGGSRQLGRLHPTYPHQHLTFYQNKQYFGFLP